MVHLVPCRRNFKATNAAKFLEIQLQGVPNIPQIALQKLSQFIALRWKELWQIIGISFASRTEYHRQTPGIGERMNAVLIQMIRGLIHRIGDRKDWGEVFPTIEL